MLLLRRERTCRGAEQFGESGTTYHSVGSNLVELLCRHKGRCGNTTVSGKALQRYHSGIAVTADNDAFYLVGVSTEGKAQEILEACAIECATYR